MTFILIDNQDRSKLCEGVTSGIGFAFCKRDADTLTTVMPISPCKDFLNDVVYSEHTGKPYRIYGLSTTKQDIFSDGWAYIAMGIMPTNRTTSNKSNHAELVSALESHHCLLVAIEDMMKLPNKTTFYKVATNRVVAVVPLFWVKYTYLISLWSLLVRIGLKYNGGDVFDFISKVSDSDAYLCKEALPKIKQIIKGKLPHQNLDGITEPHSTGIYSFKF